MKNIRHQEQSGSVFTSGAGYQSTIQDMFSDRKPVRRGLALVKLGVLLGILIGVPLYIYFVYPELFAQFKTQEGLTQFIGQHQTASALIYIGVQTLQMVLAFIPGQLVQMTGGYLFGPGLGYLYSIIGIALGTIAAYVLARFLGRDAMYAIFGEKRFARFVELMQSPRAFRFLFILFIIPGIPKDFLCYAAGVASFSLRRFLFICLVGRTPAMMGSILIGAFLEKGSYLGVFIVAAVVAAILVICFLKRRAIIEKMDVFYRKEQARN